MQENGEKREEKVIEVQPKIIEGQTVLDYNNSEDRKEIRDLLFDHFDEGRTDSEQVYRIVSSPGASPRIINASPKVIGSHLGAYNRWERGKDPEVDIEVVGEGKIERFKQDIEGEVSEIRDKVESMEDLLGRRHVISPVSALISISHRST